MLKRPLLIMTGLFAIGIYAGVQEVNRLAIILISVISVVVAFFCLPKKRALCIGAAICLFLGLVRIDIAQKHRRDVAARYGGNTSFKEMVVTDFSDNGKVIASFRDKGKTYKAYLRTAPELQLYPGDVVRGDFSLTEPYRSKTSVTDFSTYLCSMDVYLYAKADNVEVAGHHSTGIDGLIYSARTFMDKVGQKNFNGTSRAFFNAMVFGDKRLISDDLSNALQASGLNHIAVVSGMHITMIIMVQTLLLEKLFGKRRYVSIIVILGAVLITVLTGAGASILRALVMSIVFQLSRLIYRENDVITTLGSSALILLIVNPYFLFNAGFILSVLSVLGIVLYSEKFSKALKGVLPKFAGNALAVSAAAQFAVTPAVVLYFRVVTPYALIANLLIFSVATIFAVAGMVFFFLSEIPGVSEAMNFGMQFMSDVTESVCYGVSKVPGALLETWKITPFFLLGWIFIMVIVYKYPVKLKNVCKLLCVFTASIVVFNTASNSYKMELSFADYGGTSMSAIRLCDGGAILIDCPDFFDAMSYEENFDEELDCVILTTSRMGEVFSFINNSRPKVMIVPGMLTERKLQNEIISKADEENVRVIFLQDGEQVGVEGAWIEFFPLKDVSGRALKIEYKGKTFVTLQGLSGKDIGTLCESGTKIDCDYLKIPYTVFHRGTTPDVLTDGKVIRTEKNVVVR